MVIVAQSGGDALLLDMEDGFGGRVLDTRRGVLHRPMALQSILARGYWSDYTGPQNVEERLDGATRVDLDADAQAEYDALVTGA